MDEQGDVGRVSSSVSESTDSITVPRGDESSRENLGSEGKVEGPCNEGEGEEIMVEVVGSDVFVDGVGGHAVGSGKEGLGRELESIQSEGDLGLREVGDSGDQERDNGNETGLEGSQGMAVPSGEGVEHVLVMEKVEVVTEPLREQNSVDSVEKVEVTVSEEMVVEGGECISNVARDVQSFNGGNNDPGDLSIENVSVSDTEMWNPGIESANVSSSLMPERTSAHTPYVDEEAAVAVRQEDLSGRDEAPLDEVANSPLPGEASVQNPYLDEEAGVGARQEDLRSSHDPLHDGAVNAPSSGEDQSSVIEMYREATDQSQTESSDNPAEASAVMQVEGVITEDNLHSTIQSNAHHSTGCDGISEDIGRAHPDCSASGFSIEPTQIGACNTEAVNSKSVNPVSGGLPTENTQSLTPNHLSGYIEDQKFIVEAEIDSKKDGVVNAEAEISTLETQIVDEKACPLVNSEGLSIERENVLSDGKEKTVFHSEGSHDVNAEITYGDIESDYKSDAVGSVETLVVEEKGIPLANREDLSIRREDPSPDDKDKTIFHSEKSHGVDAEATNGVIAIQPSSTLLLNNLSSVSERIEAGQTDAEEPLDYGGKPPGSDAHNSKSSCLRNDEGTKIVKLDESTENDVAPGHNISTGDQTESIDISTVTALGKDEALKFEGEGVVDVRYSPAIETSIQFDAKTLMSSDKGLLEDTRTSIECNLVAEGDNEVMDDKNTSVAKVLDGDASNRNDEKLGSAGASNAASFDEHIDTDISNVTTCDTSEVPNMSPLASDENLMGEMVHVSEAEHVFRGDSSPGAEARAHNTDCLGSNPVFVEQYVEGNKEEILEQQAEAVAEMMDPGLTGDPGIDTDVVPVSEVNVIAESASGVNSAVFSGDSNSIIGLSEGNVHRTSDDIFPQDGDQSLESHAPNVVYFSEPVNQGLEVEDESCKMINEQDVHVHGAEPEFMDFQQEVEVDTECPVGDQVDNSAEELQIDQHSSETNHSKLMGDKTENTGTSLKLLQSGCLLPPENEGQFSVSDLVWGKVKSHPWWPGQIFDHEDASEKAVKYFKKDCFLVAYFGDRTFAWNDASVLKPFRSYFSQIVKQSSSETFQNAVSSALTEVSRRVELALTCSCIPRDVFGNLEYQIVENAGIREESSKQYIKDKSSGSTSFEPGKLIDYVRGLAQSASGRIDQLDVVIAQAQLVAFCRYNGYRPPPEFVSGGEWLEDDAGLVDHEIKDEQNLSNKGTSQKRKHDLKDDLQPRKKERSMSELMGDVAYSPDAEDDPEGNALGKPISSSLGRKMKAVDSLTDVSDTRISIYAAKVSTTTTTTPKPSFRIGECIRRVASQLTGSASFKSNSEQPGNNLSLTSENAESGNSMIPTEFSSLNEVLLQLQLVAQHPKGECSVSNDIIAFFSCFRNSVVSGPRQNSHGGKPGSGRKRKASQPVDGAGEEFEFDDANDSYWTDRIVQNYSEEQLLQNGGIGGGEHPLMVSDPARPQKPGRKPHSRKRYSTGKHGNGDEEPFEFVDRKMQKMSPAELILYFAEGSLPSEQNLNRIFRRFGPLKESDTEVDHESCRARVVFKRGSDAEVAYSSAGVVNIFGSVRVNYQLSYSPSSSLKPLSLAILPGQEEAT